MLEPLSIVEEWREIPGIPEYEVSALGKVKRVQAGRGAVAGRILRPSSTATGHLVVRLHINGNLVYRKVHQLVAIAFIGPIPEGYAVHHIDGEILNNHYSNLEIVPRGHHSSRHNRGEGNGQSKLSEQKVLEIKRLLSLGELSQRKIGERYGVCQQTITNIKRGLIWRHI